ncbi:hypothetical protein E2C01_080669 [Portunus trituberculatus]|uniref:Uncharacterized protein n=1 Tax=Portunus trituberculatus TaxID=210409 RepID=A0A5B7IMT0_PORTR|nr:hypothetical protein [Portunus trituberculatus]
MKCAMTRLKRRHSTATQKNQLLKAFPSLLPAAQQSATVDGRGGTIGVIGLIDPRARVSRQKTKMPPPLRCRCLEDAGRWRTYDTSSSPSLPPLMWMLISREIQHSSRKMCCSFQSLMNGYEEARRASRGGEAGQGGTRVWVWRGPATYRDPAISSVFTSPRHHRHDWSITQPVKEPPPITLRLSCRLGQLRDCCIREGGKGRDV